MEFKEILNMIINIRNLLEIRENEEIKHILKRIVNEYDIELIEIFSFEVFLKLYIHKNKSYLALDMSFWIIFENFIKGYMFCDKTDSENNFNLMSGAFNIMSMMITCFCRFDFINLINCLSVIWLLIILMDERCTFLSRSC